MAIANSTIVATVNSNINPVWIDTMLRISIERLPFTFQLGVFEDDLSMKNSKVARYPIRDEIAKATSYSETDLVTSTPITRQHIELTTAKVIKASFLSVEAVELSMWTEFENAFDELIQANFRAVDDDFKELADDFTGFTGTAATTMTVRELVKVHTTYRAQVKAVAQRPIMYFEGSVMAQLQDDAVSSGAALIGGPVGVQLSDATKAVNLGEVATWNGIDMVTTDGLPPGDVTGISNMIISTGRAEGAIAMPFQHMPRAEQAHRPENQGFWAIVSFNYVVGIARDNGGMTFITKP